LYYIDITVIKMGFSFQKHQHMKGFGQISFVIEQYWFDFWMSIQLIASKCVDKKCIFEFA